MYNFKDFLFSMASTKMIYSRGWTIWKKGETTDLL